MTKNELKAMADRIKSKRKLLMYTQEQFAEVIGISTSSYTRIENAFQRPSLDTLIKISKNLDLSLDYIVLGISNDEVAKVTDVDVIKSILDYIDDDKVKHTIDILNKLSKAKCNK